MKTSASIWTQAQQRAQLSCERVFVERETGSRRSLYDVKVNPLGCNPALFFSELVGHRQ
jgi:hypothetical protein